MSGLPVDADGNFSTGSDRGCSRRSHVLVGVTTAAMFSVQGGIYLMLKTEGELHDRIARTLPRLMIVFFLLNTLVVDRDGPASTRRSPSATSTTSGRSSSRRPRSPRSAAAWLMVRRGEPFRAFLARPR